MNINHKALQFDFLILILMICLAAIMFLILSDEPTPEISTVDSISATEISDKCELMGQYRDRTIYACPIKTKER